jgi:hypothetical protein
MFISFNFNKLSEKFTITIKEISLNFNLFRVEHEAYDCMCKIINEKRCNEKFQIFRLQLPECTEFKLIYERLRSYYLFAGHYFEYNTEKFAFTSFINTKPISIYDRKCMVNTFITIIILC